MVDYGRSGLIYLGVGVDQMCVVQALAYKHSELNHCQYDNRFEKVGVTYRP